MDLLRRQRQSRILLTAVETSGGRSLATRRTIQRPWRQSGLSAGERVRRKFPKFCLWVYIARPYRCDRVEQLGGTEMHNCKQLLQLGVTESSIGCTEIENLDRLSDLDMTEMEESVRPKSTKKFWKFKSMTNRGLRVLLTQSGSNLT